MDSVLKSLSNTKLLARWLKNKGISSYYEMSEEEKSAYRQMETLLEGKRLTDDDVADFWRATLDDIEAKLSSPGLSDKERDFLIVELRFVRKVRTFLIAPEVQARNARLMVESQLSE